MKWSDYYSRFPDWAASTQISRISSLTDFTSSAEVTEIAGEFMDEAAASRLVNRALKQGVRFLPEEVILLVDFVDEQALKAALLSRAKPLTPAQYEELYDLFPDTDLLEAVAREDRVGPEFTAPPPSPDPEFTADRPVSQPRGLLPVLAALLAGLSSAPSSKEHPGRCTGDCSSCPDHYGYRYGRRYYGRHHSHGCEFGGNRANGEP